MTTAVTGHELAGALRERFPEAVVDAADGAVWIVPAAIAMVLLLIVLKAGF